MHHFGKIGTGDILLLAQEIEKERKAREESQKAEDMAMSSSGMAAEEEPSASFAGPVGEIGSKVEIAEEVKPDVAKPKMVADVEGDVKMEER